MKLEIDQLIADYVNAQQELKIFLSNAPHSSNESLSNLDKKLQLAFDSLISAKIDHDISHVRRANFLLTLIKNMESSNGVVIQMLEKIREDVNAAIPHSDDGETNVVSLLISPPNSET